MSGKVCLITGAAGGLGSATARLLSADGVRLVLMDLDGDRLDALAKELPGPVVVHAGGVASEADGGSAGAAGVGGFGRFDLHHLNAGVPGPLVRLPELAVADWDRVMGINLRGV